MSDKQNIVSWAHKFVVWSKMKRCRFFSNKSSDSRGDYLLSVLRTSEMLRRIYTQSWGIVVLNEASTVRLHFASVCSRLFENLE